MNDNKSQKFESVVGGLFYGEVEENRVFPFPQFSQEQKEMSEEMISAIKKFGADNLDSEKFDTQGEIPKEVVMGLAELGLCGLAVSEDYGGMGLDYSIYSRIFSEISSIDPSTATMLGAHQSIGYRALLNEGTSEQKAKWLPRLASGEDIAAFCLTEPGSGSDAYSIKSKAKQDDEGNWVINGQKLWITNAGLATFYTVFCKTDVEIEGKIKEKISCFIIEKDREGVSFGEKENKMGIKGSETRAVYFDNVKIPNENLLGPIGSGFKIAMNVLNTGRLSLGAGCVGGMKCIINLATEHANTRKQFGMPIAEFGMIQEKLARMAALCYATESMVFLTTANLTRGMEDFQLETAVCKIYGSEALWQVVDMGMQIAGGNGYMKEYPYERIMRDSRINMIFEGTNEILRCFLALSGVSGPSESLKELGKISDVAKALKDPIKSFGVLTSFAKGRISKMLPSRSLTKYHKKLETHADNFSSMLSSFAIQVENTLIKYGKKIIQKEMEQTRISNMAMELYAILSVLSRTTWILESNEVSDDKKDYVVNLCNLVCDESRKHFVSNYKAMAKNVDREMKETSQLMGKFEGYALDIVDF